ncbi:hypothetical protein BpHYR1_013881 [Brachionus plicatilis]|uniref:Uncharacterized protein n=1 Tax=Brachionus plicatilis TaxID=10195 RepID=A0A3M7PNL5_BRAPC|nr:hypothetical protein BpHYR1_013881 [Brachionus plicatilis]
MAEKYHQKIQLNLITDLNNALSESNQDLLGEYITFDFDFFNAKENESDNQKNDDVFKKNDDVFVIIRQKLYNEVFQENSTLTWTLTKTQKEGFKVISCGYANSADKPTLSKIPTANTLYWKC